MSSSATISWPRRKYIAFWPFYPTLLTARIFSTASVRWLLVRSNIPTLQLHIILGFMSTWIIYLIAVSCFTSNCCQNPRSAQHIHDFFILVFCWNPLQLMHGESTATRWNLLSFYREHDENDKYAKRRTAQWDRWLITYTYLCTPDTRLHSYQKSVCYVPCFFFIVDCIKGRISLEMLLLLS